MDISPAKTKRVNQKNRLVKIFGLVFAFSLVLQTILWQYEYPLDIQLWSERSAYLQQDILELGANTDLGCYTGHPGTSVLITANTINTLTGISHLQSVQLAMTILNALFIGVVATILAYGTRRFLVWSTVAISLSFHALYTAATPTTIVVSSAILILYGLGWLLYQNLHSKKTELVIGIFFSFLAGIALATVTGITIIYIIPLIPLLWLRYGFKKLLLGAILALLTLILLDPILWFETLKHARDIFIGAPGRHLLGYSNYPLSISDVFIFSPFAFLSVTFIVIALSALYINSPERTRAQGYTYLYLASASIFVGSVFYGAEFQSVRYITPLIYLWEIALILFLPFSIKQAYQLISNKASSITKKNEVSVTFVRGIQIALLVSLVTFSYARIINPDRYHGSDIVDAGTVIRPECNKKIAN